MRHICGIDGWEEWAIFPLSFLIELINCNGKIDFNSNRAEFFIIWLLTINNYHFSLSTLHSTMLIPSHIKSNGFQFKFHKNMNCWFQMETLLMDKWIYKITFRYYFILNTHSLHSNFNLKFYCYYYCYYTHLWYCACKKLNSSLIRSQFSVTVNLNGCVGCGGPCNINRKKFN